MSAGKWRLPVGNGKLSARNILFVKPGESFEEEVLFSQKLQPGQYRLVKQVEGNKTDLTVNLAADFDES
jgi:hypothetical protein